MLINTRVRKDKVQMRKRSSSTGWCLIMIIIMMVVVMMTIVARVLWLVHSRPGAYSLLGFSAHTGQVCLVHTTCHHHHYHDDHYDHHYQTVVVFNWSYWLVSFVSKLESSRQKVLASSLWHKNQSSSFKWMLIVIDNFLYIGNENYDHNFVSMVRVFSFPMPSHCTNALTALTSVLKLRQAGQIHNHQLHQKYIRNHTMAAKFCTKPVSSFVFYLYTILMFGRPC